jgi:hypothetical protein
MSRLFSDDTDKAVAGYKETYSGLSGCAVFILIPIAGFFWFVWEPLGKGLLFVALFTVSWTIPLTYWASKEIEKRKVDD